MVKRPIGISAFEFSVLSALRAAQLSRGCTPRVQACAKLAVTAQQEVAERKVIRAPNFDPKASDTALDGTLDPLERVVLVGG